MKVNLKFLKPRFFNILILIILVLWPINLSSPPDPFIPITLLGEAFQAKAYGIFTIEVAVLLISYLIVSIIIAVLSLLIKRNKVFRIIVKIILVIFILIFSSQLYFYTKNIKKNSPQPRSSKECERRGAKLANNSLWCINYKDSGKQCFSDNDCLSKKCVLGTIPETEWEGYSQNENYLRYKKYTNENLPNNIVGNCSNNDLHSYESREITIYKTSKDRKISLPSSFIQPL